MIGPVETWILVEVFSGSLFQMDQTFQIESLCEESRVEVAKGFQDVGADHRVAFLGCQVRMR